MFKTKESWMSGFYNVLEVIKTLHALPEGIMQRAERLKPRVQIELEEWITEFADVVSVWYTFTEEKDICDSVSGKVYLRGALRCLIIEADKKGLVVQFNTSDGLTFHHKA